jgi:hypothetical protein
VQWKASAQALLQHDPSTWIERSIRTLAIAIAFIYTAGWSIGHGVHRANTWLSQLSSALVMHKTHNHDPQADLPLIHEPQVARPQVAAPPMGEPAITPVAELIQRTAVSKMPVIPPSPSRQRRPRNARNTTPMGFA